jgi:predicted small lipoprotein YifL
VIGELKKMLTQSHRATEEFAEPPRRKDAKKEWRAFTRKFALAPLRLGGFPLWLRASVCKLLSVATVVKLLVVFALLLPVAACGTKTELLMPNGKRTPQDERDPSQPPSPISR